MKRITLAVRSVLVGVLLGCAAEASAEAIRVTWIGGAEGNLNDSANWDPAVVPSSEKKTFYIAVFTNSVNLSNSTSYWYPGGVEVRGNSQVVFAGDRVMPTTADLSGEYVFDIETGSSLLISGSIFYGNSEWPFVKKGGGEMKTTGWFGNSSVAGREFGIVEVRGGILHPGKGDYRWNCVRNVVVREGGTFRTTTANGLNGEFKPVFTVDAGGVVDMGRSSLRIAALKGDGVVSNGTLTVTLEREAGCVFSGLLYDTARLQPVADVTPSGATWVIGARETLAHVKMLVDDVPGASAELQFIEGVHRFVVPDITTGDYFDRQGMGVTFEAVGRNWFVNPKQTVSGDGSTTNTAFRTLVEAMANPNLRSGDTVWAMPGEYKEGYAATSAATTSNRVVVAEGVKLVSTEGPEKTFIVGADSPNPYEGSPGCGPGAIRCAWLNARSEIHGFTLTGGRTATQNGGGVTYKFDSDGGLIEDCIVSNCVAVRGGGANYVVCKRTRFYDNRNFSTGTAIGAAIHHGSAYNCLFDNHKSGNYVTLYAAEVVNCTFLPGNTVNAVHYTTDNITPDAVRNSVILCPSLDKACYKQCVFLDKKSNVSDANIGPGSFRLSAAQANLDAMGHPLADSPLRDVGLNAHYPFAGKGCMCFDLAGNERLLNGIIDLGAYEFDASDDIAVALGRRSRLAVVLDEATFGVKAERAPKGVTMSGSFQKLSATLTGTAGVTDEYKLTVSVTGEGTLVVTSGGETVGTVTAADGAQTYGIAAGSDPTKLEFAFSGTGTANIGRLKSTLGMMLLFR